jgi:AraC-like DNA-binding protein
VVLTTVKYITDLIHQSIDAEIFEIFPESWDRQREFSLYRSRPRPCSAFLFVQSDIEVSFSGDFGEIRAKKGDIVFIPEGAKYTATVIRRSGSRIGTYTVNFDLFSKDREKLLLSERISVLASRQDTLFERRIKELSDTVHRLEDAENAESYNKIRAKGDFFLLLAAISDTLTVNDDSYYPIRRGVDAFQNEWNKNERIEKYAELCGVSETYFYRCFKRWSGVSPVEYRNNLRLSGAESLLKCTDMQIQEISSEVGFTDPFYFCRIFSQRYGISPRQYRKLNRSDQ